MTGKPPPDSPDLDALAKRYLELWNQQMGQMAGDPALAGAMAQALNETFKAMSQGMAVYAKGFAKPGEADGPQPPRPGAQTPAAASGPADDELSLLHGRLAALEKRLAVLERAVLNPGPGTRKRKPRGSA
jgi:hypothetical protein